MRQKSQSRTEFEYMGLPLVALGVTYTPGEPATLISPPVQDNADWDVLYLRSDPGCHDLTGFFSVPCLDGIEEAICETFRE